MPVTTVAHRTVSEHVRADERVWSPRFPSLDLVSAAAGLFTPLPAWDGSEGARRRIVVSGGVVAVRSQCPAKRQRYEERQVAARKARTDVMAVEQLLDLWLTDSRCLDECDAPGSWVERARDLDLGGLTSEQIEGWLRSRDARAELPPVRVIKAWSMRSRSRMIERLASLDYAPLLAGGRRPGMLTLTYGDDWLGLAPHSAAVVKHLKALRLRHQRRFGVPMVGVWKREFQDRRANCWECRRGEHVHPDSGRAPHVHVLVSAPEGVTDEAFRLWVADAWVSIVGATGEQAEKMRRVHSHPKTFDVREGARCSDPKRLAVYFSKHGTFQAKDYQNQAPDEWVAAGSVGRFWGFWGLSVVAASVEVSDADALAAARVMRRWSRANSHRVQRQVWRSTGVRFNPETGEVTAGKWRRRRSGVRVYRMRGSLGFLAVNDGPAFASQLAVAVSGRTRSSFRDWSLARSAAERPVC